jgi:hypothetical protein
LVQVAQLMLAVDIPVMETLLLAVVVLVFLLEL